jgi:hypothetical protein
MNIYFLVEGKRTEKKVYPKWLSHLIPKLQRINEYQNVDKNNYYIFSGNGFPSLLDNHLRNCIEDINSIKKYDYFVICLDADEQNIEQCKQDIFDFMTREKIVLSNSVKFEIIVQNKCFETWFLGNPKIFKKNPENVFLKECVSFYNVKSNDPELMGKIPDFEGSTSIFHSSYLQQLLLERNIQYSKNNPQGVVEEYFLQNLINRNKTTGHIESFKSFVDFCDTIKTEMAK